MHLFIDKHLAELDSLVDGQQHDLVFEVCCPEEQCALPNQNFIKSVKCVESSKQLDKFDSSKVIPTLLDGFRSKGSEYTDFKPYVDLVQLSNQVNKLKQKLHLKFKESKQFLN